MKTYDGTYEIKSHDGSETERMQVRTVLVTDHWVNGAWVEQAECTPVEFDATVASLEADGFTVTQILPGEYD